MLKLGCKPPVHTRRTMRLSIAIHKALATLSAPPTVSDDYVSAVMQQSPQGWINWWNSRRGDCVCEDSGHEVMLHTANSGTIIVPSPDDILKLYEAVGGFDPSKDQPDGSNPTDQGCDEQAMCQYMITTGLCGQKSAATGPLDPTNQDHICWAVQLFGACRLGILVTDAMMQAFSSGNAWTSADGNVEGGHDVPVVKYDKNYAYAVTWGRLQPVAWSLMSNPQFLQEAHCSVDPDFVRAGGTTPAGFDLATMLADAQAIEMQEAAWKAAA